MAVTMADIQHLRKMTGAGMMDCKNALTEANNDMEKAIELIRKRGQAIAAKRSDRDASEGCVLAGINNDFAAIVAVACETDFVAKNADFIALTKSILDLALTNQPESKEALLALDLDGLTVADRITDRSGVTGEKMELAEYSFVKGGTVTSYIHPGNKLATIVAFAQENAEYETIHGVAMHIAAMAPIAIDADGISQEVKDKELAVAIEKTKAEQVNKAVEAAIRKAGINPAHVDSDDHIESNMAKGWITPEQAAQAREIKQTVAEEKANNLPEQMIQNIAAGRMAKFFKECTLVEQKYEGGGDNTGKATVKEVLAQKNLTCTAFKHFTLNQE